MEIFRHVPPKIRFIFAPMKFLLTMGGSMMLALASARASTSASGAYPATFDEFLKQNAANEKSHEVIRTLVILLIGILAAIWLLKRWLLPR